MPRARAFWLLHYLTLALAGVCLAYAELPFLPEVALGLIPYLRALPLAWRVEGRWVLPNWGADLPGRLVAVGAGWWVTRGLSEQTGWMEEVPLHAAVIPYLGPVLMALLAVKVFRPPQAAGGPVAGRSRGRVGN